MKFGVTSLGCLLLERPESRCVVFLQVLFPFLFFSFIFFIIANFLVCCVCVVKKCPKLKNRYKSRIEAAVDYAKTIDDFDDLVDPQTLAHHCLIPKPSAYVLCAIKFEEKSKCPFFFPPQK